MTGHLNKERVNDTAKLVMHRLIARALGRDPSLVEKAKLSHNRLAVRYPGQSFVEEWDKLLDLPVLQIRHRLTSRDEKMARLRLSSPFVLAEGIDFEDEGLRRRIWRAAKRIVGRSTGAHRAQHLRKSA